MTRTQPCRTTSCRDRRPHARALLTAAIALIAGTSAAAERATDLGDGGLSLSRSRVFSSESAGGGLEAAFGRSPTGLTRVAERAFGASAYGAGVGDDTFLKARAGVFFARATASRAVGDGTAGGPNNIDLDDALGADPDSTQPIASVEVALPVLDLKIDVGYLGTHELEAQTTQSLSFDGQTFTGNVTTQDTFDLVELNVAYELLELSPSEALGVKVYVGAGMRFVTWRSEISGTVGGSPGSAEDEVFVPLPVVGGGARVDFLNHFYVSADLYLAEYGDFGRVTDVEAVLGYDLFRNAGVFVGYRQIIAETDAFDIEFDAQVEGFFIGAELRL
ncbi:MAG: hypothetical protein AAF108_03720 [Planctomycetota bacterium]